MNTHVPLNVAGRNGVLGLLAPLTLLAIPAFPRDLVNVSENLDVAVVDLQRNLSNAVDPFPVLHPLLPSPLPAKLNTFS